VGATAHTSVTNVDGSRGPGGSAATDGPKEAGWGCARTVATGQEYRLQAGGFDFAARAVFLSHHLDNFGGGADESNFGSFADLGEVGVFGEEAVAGVNGVDVGDFRGADHLRDVQVTFCAAGRTDADRFIGKADVQGVAVGLGIDGHGGNAEFLARANDA